MSEGKIYSLIGQAMSKIGAIGKDSTATNNSGKRMYNFRGIDAVYNALNPVMAELGLFICPEVLEQTREERKSTSGGTLIYSILKIKFTMYAPDGSNVSCVVIGEGMDSGDKASNKAMSVALKYACFEMFMIPTEEMVDPDAEVHEVAPRTTVPANVTTQVNVPQPAPKAPEITPQQYIKNEMVTMAELFGIKTEAEMMKKFQDMRNGLIEAKIIPDVKSKDQTMKQAQDMIDAMYKNFTPSGAKK